MTTYTFDHFTIDGVIDRNNPTTVNMSKDRVVVANYLEETGLGTITFNGTVSGQVAPRPVTIRVTKPGGGTAIVNTTTLADKTFTATYTDVAGSYSAIADVAADAQYAAGSSPVVNFSISLTPTVVTLTVA